MSEGHSGIAEDTKHFTRGGDRGRTKFGGYGDVPKGDSRVVAYAEADEANAVVGVAVALGGMSIEVQAPLASVQNDLFDLVSDLRMPLSQESKVRILPGHVERLDRMLEHFRAEVDDMAGFVLPGGTVPASLLFQARAAVRRAERAAWQAIDEFPDDLNPEIARYLNRLSSVLFVLAREANREHGDVIWRPGLSVEPAPAEETGGEE